MSKVDQIMSELNGLGLLGDEAYVMPRPPTFTPDLPKEVAPDLQPDLLAERSVAKPEKSEDVLLAISQAVEALEGISHSVLELRSAFDSLQLALLSETETSPLSPSPPIEDPSNGASFVEQELFRPTSSAEREPVKDDMGDYLGLQDLLPNSPEGSDAG